VEVNADSPAQWIILRAFQAHQEARTSFSCMMARKINKSAMWTQIAISVLEDNPVSNRVFSEAVWTYSGLRSQDATRRSGVAPEDQLLESWLWSLAMSILRRGDGDNDLPHPVHWQQTRNQLSCEGKTRTSAAHCSQSSLSWFEAAEPED
jgi:hypothetical protein